MKQELDDILNTLWGSIIKSIEFCLLTHSIRLRVKTDEIINEVIFQEVSSYYFLNEDGENRFSFGTYNGILELSEIYYEAKGIGTIALHNVKKDKEWAQSQYSNANFYLLIWNSSLFIEAQTVIINGAKYSLCTDDVKMPTKKNNKLFRRKSSK